MLAFCRSYRIIIYYLYILLGLLIPSIVFIKRSLEEISGDSDESMGESRDSSEEEEISEAEAEARRTAKGKGKEVLPSTESESHESSSSYVEDSSEVDKGQLLEDSDDLWEAKSKIRNLAENGVIDKLRKGQDVTPQEFQDYLDVQEEYGERLESYTNEGLDNQSALENLESELDDDLKYISDKLGSFDWDREVPKRTKLDSDSEKEYSSESSTVSTPKAVPASLTDSSPTPTPTSRPASDSTPSTAVPDSSTIPTPTNNPKETPSEYVQSISEGEMPSYTDPEDT